VKEYDSPYALTRLKAAEYTRLYGSYALTCAESLLARRGRSRPYVYWCALVLCAGILIALPLVKVDLTVQEFGRVRPATERSAIVARTAGFVAALKVHDNDLVQAGETLAVLNSAALQAKFDLNASQTKLREAELTDLRALLTAVSVKTAVSAKRPVSASPLSGLEEPKGCFPNLNTAKYIAEYQQFVTSVHDASLKMERAIREMNRTRDLLEKKVVAARDADEAAFAANETRTGLESVYRDAVARWQAQSVTKTTELDQLKTEYSSLLDERELYSIRAPTAGAVIGLIGIVEGSYVQAGQRIGDISPTSDFVFDVSVPPKDIGRLYKGQSTRLQIDAYPYTIWGLLTGKIISISADYVNEADNNGGFKVIVRPDAAMFHTRDGLEGALRKGMTGNARFFVARRSLLELIYESMDKLFNPVRKQRPGNA
jgi:membrane fusion protein, peptide pheromone/bacteriocin exporter